MSEEKTNKIDQEYWLNLAKKFTLAGLGAVAFAQEEVEVFVGKLVERGEIAEQEGKKWLKEFVEKSRKHTKDAVHNIGENSIDGLEKLLARLNIPTKKEFQELTQRVEELAKRVDDLTKKPEPPSPQNPN